MGKLRIGVAGCGDVSHRHYFPPLAEIPDRLELIGFCDPRPGAAADAVSRWSPRLGCAYTDLATMLSEAHLDAVYNLTPAPLHAGVTRECLSAGVDVYSEKPIAASVAEATELIDLARARRLQLLCAPGSAATRRVQWLREVVDSGLFGPVALLTAHHADTGPATWREYTGDPRVFYGPGVGPVFDHGIYRLHEMTTILGPVRRVQAMGNIAVPTRVVRAGPLARQTIATTGLDNVAMNLEFASGVLGTLLASFATPATMAPWLELHFRDATISFPAKGQYDLETPADLFRDDESPLGIEGWQHDVTPPPPAERWHVVETGAMHFVEVLEGVAAPLLTAEHARHVLDVILKAYESIADGQSHLTETTF